jgi:translocation and assembly module TamB
MEAARKSRWRRRLALAAGATLLIGGGGAVVFGPAAPWIIDSVADGQRVWRLGRIEIDGVEGAWLGNLRAAHVRIADSEGVWLEAENVALHWAPMGILFGNVNLNGARAERIAVLRQPVLTEARPPSGAEFNIRLADIQVAHLDVAEAVVGQAAQFTGNFALNLRGDDLQLLQLSLTRLDSEADRAAILYRPDEEYALDAEIVSARGGVLARLLGFADEGFSARARGEGDPQTGQARYSAAIGEAQLITGEAAWTPARWSAEGAADLERLPFLAALTKRIGANVQFTASGERVGAFEVSAQTPYLALEIDGVLNEDREIVDGARILATTERASAIAPEAPIELGAARFEGELRRARGTTAVRGTLDAQEIDAFGQRVRFTGPARAALTQEAFTLTADLAAGANAPALFANGRLRTQIEYDRGRRRFSLERATLESQALAASAQGWARRGDGEFSGEWRVRQVSALSADLSGSAAGAWRAFAAPVDDGARVWTTTLQGRGANIAGSPDLVPQLLGASPTLDAMLRNENGGITVAHARIEGARLRAGAFGRIVQGQANLSLEASARGPIELGGAVIDGALDATGQITGRLARPTITAEAVMQSFEAGGAVIAQPQVTFTLAPSGNAYSGHAELIGAVSGQPLSASSDVAILDDALLLTQLDAQVGGLAAQGSATIAARGVTAELDVNGAVDGVIPGVTGRLAGRVSLTPETMLLTAQIADARAGELFVRAANVRAQGPLDAVATTFNMRGRLRQAPLAFEGTALLDIENSDARIEGRGALAGSNVFTRAPITLDWSNGALQAAVNVGMGDGVVQAQWSERGRALTGSAQVEDAPIAPLAAIWGERATGVIDGRITIANNGRGLSGDADITLQQARFAGRQREPLDMRIVGDLDPSRLMATIDARSDDGLIAHFEANAPVVTSADPIRIALAPERRGRATWRIQGPAESLWAAARLQDQSLQGQLDGEGELEFGAGYLSGDGHIEIVDGRFEDKLTGVTLADLDARLAIDDNGVRIERFSAVGPRGGALTATGGSVNPREGSIVVTINDMRVADRPDAQARASGVLTLAWQGEDSSFSGELNIAEANIDIGANPEAGIPTLEVIEINRPDLEDETETDDDEDVALVRNNDTRLDVRVLAPGRVFTRGRGIDAEWSLDLRLGGTAGNPLVTGRAEAIRGQIALSGTPFTIENAVITFNGDPLDARINLTAVRDTADLSATMRLTGTARDPEIAFSSDPALPEDEILPQILFGRGVADLSAFEAAQLASSLATLSGRASLDLVDAARAAAGLDRFAVRQDESGGFLVAGGVYLTRDVYVEVARTGLGQAQTQLEWTIRPRLVLITTFRGDGDQRVSLRWRRESD